ncbi:MAG TPA: invasin domain 3-containing protein [Solirubrobacteraceae bacterium]|jgi:hypothetical protein|nr:invasin domain 3-containing protein [Solirubrobacteraceae bacterium]
MRRPQLSLPVHPKVAGATGGTTLGAAIAVVLALVGVHLDAAEIGVLEMLATLLAGYLTPAPGKPAAATVQCGEKDRDHPSIRRELAAINERLGQQMIDYTALQEDVATLQGNVAAVKDEVQKLEAASSSEQATVDALDADVKAANAALEGLIPAPAPVPSSISVSLSPPTLPPDGASIAVASATVTDSAGAPLASETVLFTSSDPAQHVSATTNAGAGVYTATIQAGATAGTATITASDGSLTGAASLTQG